jgi:hypothetical protein
VNLQAEKPPKLCFAQGRSCQKQRPGHFSVILQPPPLGAMWQNGLFLSQRWQPRNFADFKKALKTRIT